MRRLSFIMPPEKVEVYGQNIILDSFSIDFDSQNVSCWVIVFASGIKSVFN